MMTTKGRMSRTGSIERENEGTGLDQLSAVADRAIAHLDAAMAKLAAKPDCPHRLALVALWEDHFTNVKAKVESLRAELRIA